MLFRSDTVSTVIICIVHSAHWTPDTTLLSTYSVVQYTLHSTHWTAQYSTHYTATYYYFKLDLISDLISVRWWKGMVNCSQNYYHRIIIICMIYIKYVKIAILKLTLSCPQKILFLDVFCCSCLHSLSVLPSRTSKNDVNSTQLPPSPSQSFWEMCLPYALSLGSVLSTHLNLELRLKELALISLHFEVSPSHARSIHGVLW